MFTLEIPTPLVFQDPVSSLPPAPLAPLAVDKGNAMTKWREGAKGCTEVMQQRGRLRSWTKRHRPGLACILTTSSYRRWLEARRMPPTGPDP